MSTNAQAQKITPPKIRRLRHRRRLVAGSPRVEGRHPALDNFLTREVTRLNALGGVSGVTEAEILAAVEGVGTSDKNRNTADAFDIQVSAQLIRAMTVSGDLDDAGIPIV